MEEDLLEKLELLKKAGCKMVKCKVVDRNIELNKEIIELKEENKELKKDKALQIQMNKRLIEEGIPISVIQNKLEQNKAKTDCRYCNNACDSYAVCTVLKEILEKGNK